MPVTLVGTRRSTAATLMPGCCRYAAQLEAHRRVALPLFLSLYDGEKFTPLDIPFPAVALI